jgi:hypothetical protein
MMKHSSLFRTEVLLAEEIFGAKIRKALGKMDKWHTLLEPIKQNLSILLHFSLL